LIVKYEFDYWGSNGREYYTTMDEYYSLKDCVSTLGYTAFNDALDDEITIIKILNSDVTVDELKALIKQEVDRLARLQRIGKLKDHIQIDTKWLDTVDNELERRRNNLAKNIAELHKLENEPS
jgi:hypothetical protein